jgi:hypothetical protein
MKPFKILGVLVSLILATTIPSWGGSNYTVNVGPPSDGDDTSVLQAALDDCMNNHPTGCTIQLSAGTYKTQQLFGEDFHGSLKGMGMDATIIQALPLLEVTSGPVSEGSFDVNPPTRTNKYPYLIIFAAGDITVSDMTYEVTEHDPVTSWCFYDQCGQTWLFGIVGVIGTSANLLVERVGFDGGPGTSPVALHNYDKGTFFMGLSGDQPLTGTFKVVSSRFRNGEDSLVVLSVSNARITIGGSPSDGNVVESGAQGAGFLDLGHSAVEYSYNKVTVSDYPWAGVLAGQGYAWIPQESSQFLVQHNTIKTTGGYVDGIWAVDFGPPSGLGKTADFVISDNTIQLAGSETDPAWAGVEAVLTVDAVISNNRISGGNALLGIAAEGSSQCMLLGNNLQQLEPLWAPVGLLGASLDTQDTAYCTVVGGNNKTSVYDEGTGNVLVGVNNMQGNPPGPAIKEAMRRKLDLLKSLRRR